MLPILRIANGFRIRLPFADRGRPLAIPPYVRRSRSWLPSPGALLGVAGLCLFCFIWGAGFGLTAPALILFFAAPIPILGAVAIWAMPELKAAPTRTLARLVFVYLGCMLLWPNYIALALPGLPWITMTRLTGVPLMLLLAICAASSAAFRREMAEGYRSSRLVVGLFVAYVGFTLLSVVLAKQPVSAFNQFFNAQISSTCFFLASICLFREPGRATRVFGWIWFCAIAVGVISIFEFRLQHPVWAGHIPSFLKIEDAVVERVLAGSSRSGAYRTAGTFTVSLGLAEFISLVVPFVIHFAVGPFKTSTRVAAAASIPFLLGVTYITGARLGLVGCFLAIILSGLFWGVRTWRRRPKSYVAPLVVLGVLGAAGLVIAAATFVGRIHAVVSGGAAGQMSNDGRKIQWAMGLPKLWARPWGYGLGSSGEVVGYAPGGYFTIDSDYLSKLIDVGLLGCIVYYLVFLISAVNAARSAYDAPPDANELDLLMPLSITVVNFFIIKSVFASAANDPIIFLCLGMIIALRRRAADARAATPPVAVATGRLRHS